MRYMLLAATALTLIASPAISATKQAVSPTPTFDDCYRLAWVRGVHVEQNELDGFAAACMAGQIPFDSGFHADSVQPSK